MQQDALNKGFTRMGKDELGLYRYKDGVFLGGGGQDGAGWFGLWRVGALRQAQGRPAALFFQHGGYGFYHRGHGGFFTEGTKLLRGKRIGGTFLLRGTEARLRRGRGRVEVKNNNTD
jgi:hypothetical protein